LSAGEDGILPAQDYGKLYQQVLDARRGFFEQLSQALP
jgi:hypothetical protein